MPSRRKISVRKSSRKMSIRKSSKKSVRKSSKKSLRKKSLRKKSLRKKSLRKKSLRKSKRGVKFGVKRITNCNPNQLEGNNVNEFLLKLNKDLLNWGNFLLDKESVDKQKYYTYFYNIRGTTDYIRQNYIGNFKKNPNPAPEESKVDKYFDTVIDPKIYEMRGTYKKDNILIQDSQNNLKAKITELVKIHTEIWQFLIKIDRCEASHTPKIRTDVCKSKQKIFFPPAIRHEVFQQDHFLDIRYGNRNYSVNPDSGKIKKVFYKGDGSDGKMYRQSGTISMDYYLYNNLTHTFNEKKDNGILGKDYHTICIDDKGIAAPLLKLFNGISSLLCFMFIFLDPIGSQDKIDKSYGKSSSGGLGTALNALATTMM